MNLEGPIAAVAALDDMLSAEQCGLLVEAIINKYIVLSAEELQEWQVLPQDTPLKSAAISEASSDIHTPACADFPGQEVSCGVWDMIQSSEVVLPLCRRILRAM